MGLPRPQGRGNSCPQPLSHALVTHNHLPCVAFIWGEGKQCVCWLLTIPSNRVGIFFSVTAFLHLDVAATWSHPTTYQVKSSPQRHGGIMHPFPQRLLGTWLWASCTCSGPAGGLTQSPELMAWSDDTRTISMETLLKTLPTPDCLLEKTGSVFPPSRTTTPMGMCGFCPKPASHSRELPFEWLYSIPGF